MTSEKLINFTGQLLSDKFQTHLDDLQFKMSKMPTHDLDLALSHMEYLMDIRHFDHLKSNIAKELLEK